MKDTSFGRDANSGTNDMSSYSMDDAESFGDDSANRQSSRANGRGLGWFSLGLGIAQVVAPRALARGIGLRGNAATCTVMRLIGAREILAGLGILRRRRPRGWLWARVAGDAVDLALLGMSFRAGKQIKKARVPVAIAAVAGVTLLDVLAARRLNAAVAMGGE